MIIKPYNKTFDKFPGVEVGMKFLCTSSTFPAYKEGEVYEIVEYIDYEGNKSFVLPGDWNGMSATFEQVLEKSGTQLAFRF